MPARGSVDRSDSAAPVTTADESALRYQDARRPLPPWPTSSSTYPGWTASSWRQATGWWRGSGWRAPAGRSSAGRLQAPWANDLSEGLAIKSIDTTRRVVAELRKKLELTGERAST